MSYGLKPTPATQKALSGSSLIDLEHEGVRFVRLTWVDLSNTIRYRIIPLAHYLALCNTEKPGISIVRAAPGFVFNTSALPNGAVGEAIYRPDLESIARLPYAPSHASVMGWFDDKRPGRDDLLEKASELCPRGLLKRVVDYAATEANAEFLVGFENEFILLHHTEDGSIRAVNNQPWSASRAMLSDTVETNALEEMVEAITAAGIVVEMYHAEAAPGQYEIVTGPLPPLQAADALIRTRETIINVAAKHGLRATFTPRVYDDNCGSACHAHISVHPTPNTPNPDVQANRHNRPQPALKRLEASFLSGVLTHLRGLAAVILPTAQSYSRVQDGIWSGGTYVSYGTDNRETPIRVCGPQGARHFELKAHDGSANPYVALAGVLGVGARAIKEMLPLEMGECKVKSAAELHENERQDLGVTERLPTSIQEARTALEQDEVVMGVLGEVGRVWRAVNEKLENCLHEEANKIGGNLMRVMIDTF